MENKVMSKQRNYGIDLLRLVAAFYVIVLHTIIRGGLLSATTPYSSQYTVCKILLIFSMCSVNIFGIVSGFVGYREPEKHFSLTGFLSLWLDVVFYSVTLTLIYKHIYPHSIAFQDLIDMFYPITQNAYWYFSSYTFVYFLAPFLNRMISHCSDNELKYLFFLICFIIVPLDYVSGCFYLGNGYSAIWLVLLYLIGAIMKKTKLGFQIHPAIAILFVFLLNYCLFFLNSKYPSFSFLNFNFDFSFEFNQSYVSPFFLGAAIFHVIIFSKIQANTFVKKIISFAAPASFAVYIVNVQKYVWLYFMNGRTSAWGTSSPVGIVVRTLCFSFLFVLAVVIADFCKRKVFHILKIDTVLHKLGNALSKNTI